MTDERPPSEWEKKLREKGIVIGHPPADLVELAERLCEHEAQPDPILRRVRILQEISIALPFPFKVPTLELILTEAIDAYRKAHIGRAVKPFKEVDELLNAAVTVTIMSEGGVRLSEAYAKVAKTAGIPQKKLKSFRANLQSRNQAAHTVALYNARLKAQRFVRDA